MNRKTNEWFCTDTTRSDNNTFRPRDDPVTSSYNLVPFLNLIVQINAFQKMSTVFISCVGEIVREEYGGTQHRSGMARLKGQSIFLFSFMKNCHDSIEEGNTSIDSLLNCKPLSKTEWSLWTFYCLTITIWENLFS